MTDDELETAGQSEETLFDEDPSTVAEADDAGDDGDDNSSDHLKWDGDTIDAAAALEDRALSYGLYVNKGRAIPDVRDGLKPVQRRALFSTAEVGARAGRPYVKSALVVGHVIGNYHPHGDTAAYDAMVRLAQSFNLNVPLIDGQGNWGSVGPTEYSDPAAAYRYTEARLTAAASDWLADLRPEIVAYQPNFTERKEEPTVLPVTFPNLLVNGSRGIGWSMACEIPPHNLGEAVAAAIVLANDPAAPVEDLLAAMPGPDFPTGGLVVSTAGLAEAYERGQGTFQLQARYHVEQLPGNVQAIVVTELPYGVSPDQIVAETVRAARAEKLSDVTEMPRNLSDRTGMRVQIRCKRGGNVTRLVSDLMRHTSLRITVKLNMTVLIDTAPRQIGLREALDRFVDFRYEVITRRLEHERAELLRDLRRLLALLAALDVIDEVIAIVRGSDDDDEAREKLKARLRVPETFGSNALVPIDDEQAQFILDMQIKRLSRLNRFRLEEEAQAKTARVTEIEVILDSHPALRDLVIGELRDAAKRYGAPRRTVLQAHAEPADETAAQGGPPIISGPRTEVVLVATRAGACAARATTTSLTRLPIQLGAGDAPAAIIRTDTASELNAFTAGGLVHRLRVAEVPIESRLSRGTKAIALIRKDRVAGLAPIAPEAGFLLLVTARGEIKRTEASIFAQSHMGGSPAFDVPDDDELRCVVVHGPDDDILLQTARGRALRISTAQLRPVKSAAAGGVAGMRLEPDDSIVAATRLPKGSSLILVHEGGLGKAVSEADYPVKGRGTGGVQSASIDAPKRAPAGAVAAVAAAAPGETILILTTGSTLAELDQTTLEPSARAAVSRPLVALGADEDVVLAAAISLDR